MTFAAIAAVGAAVLAVGLVIALFDWIGGTDPEEEMAEIEEVALDYGASEGEEACEFLSASALDQLGGESGCTRQFEDVPAADFEIVDVTVDGESGSARVENVESGMEIKLGFAKEDGAWKISSFPGIDQLAPPEGAEDLLQPPGAGGTPPTGPEAPPPAGERTP